MISYQLKNDDKGTSLGILRSDGWFIPMDLSNTDYQQYLKWLAEGNEPLPADE